ncbi:Sel1 domain-containing protein repeat-containing protein [Devosia sp. LC5]|uniref:tetratricopeptide repeat protein n=1 Tax=Devosia sp. LC5 TaxID=1502724 RepID=UPI0004E43C39|nr:SEL1-like repeat protein [Devosia sp. LC5]KFC62686.1 Sel1 domain-containing protein repeat-containing protein [Devosia sp. LC5]
MSSAAKIAFVTALCMSVGTQWSVAQEAAPQAAPEIPAVTSFDALLQSAVQDLETSAGDSGAMASMALARVAFASTDPAIQVTGIPLAEKAAELGAVEANLLLGDVYRRGGFGAAPDLVRAKGYLEAAFEDGSLQAAVALGTLYFDSDFTAEGRKRGLELLTAAADEGSIEAANALANVYLYGKGVPIDTNKALHYFGVGLVSNSNNSIVALGDVLRGGAANLQPNPDVAMEFFQHAARQGDLGAGRRIADMHLRGEAVTQSVPLAITMLTDLAKKGDTNSYIALGDIFARGEFVATDGARAIEYFKSAEALGNTTGMIRLAELYINGLPGTPVDIGQAIDLYTQAAELGNTSAKRALGRAFLTGQFGTTDPRRAIALLEDAARLGDGQAAKDLAVLYASNEPFPANYGEVKTYLDLALAVGNTGAALDIAAAIATGPLARTHREDARLLLTGAMDGGVPGAAATLARLQLDGAFPAQGVGGVISMLNNAAKAGDIDSARFLIGLYRDGYGLLLPPDPAAASDFLNSVAASIGPEATTVERIHLEALRSEDADTLASVGEQISTLSKASAIQVLDILRRKNARAYVYVLQKGLSSRGQYSGPLSGTLDATTIRAFNAVCSALSAERACAPGPLTRGALLTLGNYVLQPAT